MLFKINDFDKDSLFTFDTCCSLFYVCYYLSCCWFCFWLLSHATFVFLSDSLTSWTAFGRNSLSFDCFKVSKDLDICYDVKMPYCSISWSSLSHVCCFYTFVFMLSTWNSANTSIFRFCKTDFSGIGGRDSFYSSFFFRFWYSLDKGLSRLYFSLTYCSRLMLIALCSCSYSSFSKFLDIMRL